MQMQPKPKRLATALTTLLICIGPAGVYAQATKSPTSPTQGTDKNLADELRQLREQVTKLQSSMGQKAPASRPASGMAGMQSQTKQGAMPSQGGMGMMSMMEGEHSSPMASPNSSTAAQGMSGMEMSGMDMMGRMAGTSQLAGQTTLPGFPGLSHLYHVGAVGFFLDHPEHITLSNDQQTKLGQIKEKAMLDKASAQRKIDEAEQQLFTLTGADQPNLSGIQAKIHEIGELQGQQRLSYIQAVGHAAQILTDEQRKVVVGQADSVAAPMQDHH